MFSIEDIESWEYIEVDTVYDIQVENAHNYFISAGKEILAHNSSKTFSILQTLLHIAKKEQGCLISVVSESLPHLKRGSLRDFQIILEQEGFTPEQIWNKTDNIFQIGTSRIEFFSADNPGKVHGARRDYLFVNECNNIKYLIADQLFIRTRKTIFLDFNPVSSFWAHEHIIPHSDCFFIKTTFLDNIFLDDTIIRDIIKKKDKDLNWWRVYGLGEVGSVEGLIFPKFEVIDQLPVLESHGYGLDFGFSSDPAALIKCAIKNESLYLDEIVYRTHLLNSDLINEMKVNAIKAGHDEIIADSAEPKSIEEIRKSGFNIKGAVKGADSIAFGIQTMKEYNIFVTKRSVNLIKELRNYKYITDSNGQITTKPIDEFNHAIDAIRYYVSYKKSKPAIRSLTI